MRLSKSFILCFLVLLSLNLPVYSQQQPRGNSGPAPGGPRNNAERRRLTEQRRELRSLEMMGNNSYEEADSIKQRQMRLNKELVDLNQATVDFLYLFSQEYETMGDKGEIKDLAKQAEKVAKFSKKLRDDLELENFEVKIAPPEFAVTETRNDQMVKLVRNIRELIEQINLSQATKSSSEIKLKILARHLTALETYATSAREIARDKN